MSGPSADEQEEFTRLYWLMWAAEDAVDELRQEQEQQLETEQGKVFVATENFEAFCNNHRGQTLTLQWNKEGKTFMLPLEGEKE